MNPSNFIPIDAVWFMWLTPDGQIEQYVRGSDGWWQEALKRQEDGVSVFDPVELSRGTYILDNYRVIAIARSTPAVHLGVPLRGGPGDPGIKCSTPDASEKVYKEL